MLPRGWILCYKAHHICQNKEYWGGHHGKTLDLCQKKVIMPGATYKSIPQSGMEGGGKVAWGDGRRRKVQAQERGRDVEGDYHCILSSLPNLKALQKSTWISASYCAGPSLVRPMSGAARAQHKIRNELFPYFKEISGSFKDIIWWKMQLVWYKLF